MFNANFDPLSTLEQLQNNQAQLDSNHRNIVTVVNNLQRILQDHETRLDLNQQTINQILKSMQNQQTLLLKVFDQVQNSPQVNNTKGTE